MCRFVILFCLYFSAVVAINSDSLNSWALYAAIPVAFLLCFTKNGKLVLNKYEKILLAIYAWDLISALWAQYPSSASRELHRVLGAVLMIHIMASNAGNKKLTKYLYATYIVLYLGCWYYSMNHSLIVLDQTSDADRLNDDKLNANTMAYYTFYVTMSVFLLSELSNSKFWKGCFRVLFLAMIPLSFFVALTTASRQVLIIQIPLILFLLYERYLRNSRVRTKLLFAAIAIVLCFVLYPKVEHVYENSFLAFRAQRELQDDSRWFLLNDAIDVGLNHFPFGVGAGNYVDYSFNKHFSHCSFTELFANNGIIGLCLYCYLLYYFVRRQWGHFKRTRDRQFIVFLIFGLIFTFDQVFYVFYTDLWLIAFFVLVATHSENYYSRVVRSANI